MNNNNEKNEKKGGFLSSLSGLFRGGSSAISGASSGLGSAGSSASGLAGLFATKAGIVGLVLGGATIAAGVGVVYNFIGPSSKGVYSPELFQNSYYEEESSKAELERSKSRDASAASASTLDMFREQAKKDGLGGLASEAGEGGNNDASAANPADASGAEGAAASADAPSADAAANGAGGMPKLHASSGFGSKAGGGGSGTSIPRMQGGGGLSGGIGAQFQPVYRPPAQANSGKTSGMTASAAKINRSPKYAVPNFNKKGAFGQAKYANSMSRKAASVSGAPSATLATEAMSGETANGGGDVAGAETGAGLGGAGVSNGQNLKASDPSLNSNESSVPKPSKPEDVDPWQEYEDMAMNSMMWAGGLILLTSLLSGIAKKLASTAWGFGAAMYFFYAAVATAAAAIFYALKVAYAGFKMYSEFGQKMMGGIYILTGLMLAYQAYEALMSAWDNAGTAGKLEGATPKGFDGWSKPGGIGQLFGGGK